MQGAGDRSMSLIQFVANYDDLSTDRGYQFKFYCDKYHNGFMSRFETSVSGVAGDVLRAAGNLFGGVLGRIGDNSYQIQRAVGGKAHDEALTRAVQEGKQHFKQCSRCGKWVCPEVCWNQERGLCEGCAPDEKETLAAAQAQVASEQIFEKTRQADLIEHIDVKKKASAPTTATCPSCGAETSGKFCSECGGPMAVTVRCSGCGAESRASARFCPECGQKLSL
jgi:zinc-ribbon domain